MTDFPTAYITGITRSLRSAVLATESPFSFVQQVQDTGGERWEFSIDVMVQGLGFEVFANAVINKRREFHLALPRATRPISSGVSLTVADYLNDNVAVTGTSNGHTFKAGDFISILAAGRHRLHQVMQDAVFGGDERATLKLVPKLRSGMALGLAVEVQVPKVTLRATNKAPATIGHVIHQFSIEAVEAL